MAKHKSGSTQSSGQTAVASPSDIKQHLANLDTRLGKIRELMQDGVPYLDALKVKAELGFKETIRDIFGQSSQEFQVLRKHKIDITSTETIEKTAAILQGLLEYFEHQQQALSDRKSPSLKSPLEFAQDAQQALELVHHPPAPPSPKPSVATRSTAHREPPQKKGQAAAPSAPAKSRPTAIPSAPNAQKHEKNDHGETAQPELNLPSLPPSPPSEMPTAHRTPVETDTPPPPPPPPEPPASVPIRNVHNQQFLEKPHTLTTPTAAQGNQPMTPTTTMPHTTTAPETQSRTSSDSLELIRKICQRFHPVIRQLRERSEERPPFEIEDEHDIRDILRALLYLEFEDVGIEEWAAPSLNGAIQRDFLIQPGNLVMFVTRTRAGLGTKEITNLWTSACAHYTSHPNCQRLVGFIYDPEGRIANPRRLEETLAAQGVPGKVEIQIFPK